MLRAAAVALGADRVFVLQADHACELTRPPRSTLTMALHGLALAKASAVPDLGLAAALFAAASLLSLSAVLVLARPAIGAFTFIA